MMYGNCRTLFQVMPYFARKLPIFILSYVLLCTEMACLYSELCFILHRKSRCQYVCARFDDSWMTVTQARSLVEYGRLYD